MEKYVTPITEDDPEADPYHSFTVEFRRTIAHIRFYEEQILALPNANDMIWGETKRESIDASKTPGINRTKEAKMNMWEQALFNERRHLTDLHKIWIGAKLDAKKLEIEQQLVDKIDLALNGILQGLGKDPNDPEVRRVMREGLLQLVG